MISVVKRDVGRLTMHITLEATVSSHFIHNLNLHRISGPQQMGYTILNGGLEERAWSSHSFKTVSLPGPFLPAHFPLGDSIHGALSRPFALLRPRNFWWKPIHLWLPLPNTCPCGQIFTFSSAMMSPGTPHLSVPQVNQTHITKSKSPPPQTCSSH